MPQCRVVGFCGAYESGKDTAAECLIEMGYRQLAFADPVRTAALAVNPWIIHDSGRTERLADLVKRIGWRAAKRIAEVRRILQVVGTEAGREIHGMECWVELAGRAVKSLQAVVMTDVRFDNEAAMIRRMDGVVLEIKRPGKVGDSHKSEAGIDPSLIHRTIWNTTTIPELHRQVLEAVRGVSCMSKSGEGAGVSAG